MKRLLLTVVLTSTALATDIKSVVVHSNVPFRSDRAESCSLTTGNPYVTGGPKTKIEMLCSERTDFDPVKGAASYPYTRIVTVKLDEAATKEFFNSNKWAVDLYCQGEGSLKCQPR
jgi:hypothetical protein